MRLLSWLRNRPSNWTPPTRSQHRPTSPRFRPRVRALEDRCLPSTLASFLAPNGASPAAALVMDGSGNLYGTASQGGACGDGTVFELAKGSSTLTVLASFNGSNGASPAAALVMDGSGNLYGTGYAGGTSGDGTVFELAKGSGTITTLASFNGANGANPDSPLVIDSSGNLYGTAYAGGPSGDGTVFELAKGSGTITTLASFNGTNGANPVGALVLDSSGNLYGTAYAGGPATDGTVFKLAHGSGAIITLASFNSTNGANPQGGLIMDSGGNLYGTTVYGGPYGGYAGIIGDGTVFELAAGSGTITTLASFDGYHGAQPLGALILDGSGNLYGTTSAQGPSSTGTVFELAAHSGTITTLDSFNGTDGENPLAGLVSDSSGNVYGTSSGGTGALNDGTVFEVAQGSGTITALAAFFSYGSAPMAGLVSDSSGNLYGTTYAGGSSNLGTVFELAAGSGTITVLASFNANYAANPQGSLVMDSSGNLYGTTSSTVFELAKGSGTITNLASLGTLEPGNGLVMDSSGNLYGTTVLDHFGTSVGSVFELAKGSGTITNLAYFNGTNGAYPYAGLILDGSGNLYGTTWEGGPGWNPSGNAYGDGTVFELVKGSGTITNLAWFDGTDGALPHASLMLDGSGNLYGTTSEGGASGDGTVFELAKGSGTITALAEFNGTNGAHPYAGLVMDSSGNLYGTTAGNGAALDGTAFELPVGSGTIITLTSFQGISGNGNSSFGNLMPDGSGNLYGTTVWGGVSNLGTVFELPGAALADQWTGANFAVDTNWSDGANWSLGTPPTTGQTVLFTNGASVKDFTSTVDAGFTSVIGALNIDSTWGGTVTVNSPLAVAGNFTLASGSVGGSGAVTIAGRASQWTAGQIVVGSGGFTNTGTLNADTTGGNLVLKGAGTLTNDGTINEAGTNRLVLENSATLNNAAGATFDLIANGSVSQSGGGTLTNAGTLEKTAGTGTSTIATTTLSNTGTVAVASGTLNIAATVAQASGTTLMAGVWKVTGNSTVHSTLNITSAGSFTTLGSAAQVTLSGLNTVFSNLSGLNTIASGASFSLLGGQSFTTTSALSNNGSITLSPRSVLTVHGSFTQTSTSTLTIELGGTNKTPTFGRLVSTTGTVALGGSLNVTSTVVPAVGSAFELLDNQGDSAISGIFAGLPEGSTFTVTVGTTTMKYQITYAGKDSHGRKHNVIITRIA